MSGPLTRYCTGQPTGGPSSSGDIRETTLGNSSGQLLLQLGAQPLARGHVLGDDDGLAKKSLGSWTLSGK